MNHLTMLERLDLLVVSNANQVPVDREKTSLSLN